MQVSNLYDAFWLFYCPFCSKFLDQAARGEATENIDKHRFLVQSKVLDDNEFYRIRELPQAKKQEEVILSPFFGIYSSLTYIQL